LFGYVICNKNEMKIRDYETYRSYYCGLCHTLLKRYGRKGQALLSYDLTFLNILLESLYEEPLTERKERCIVHPVGKHHMVYNEITEYTADMCVLLTYYKLLDDWKDEHSVPRRAGAQALAGAVRKIEKLYPGQARAVRECISQLSVYEKKNESDLDKVAGLTGHMLAEVFSYRSDEWTDEMQMVGFYLGKYIYLVDAYVDLKKDVKKGSYNVWKHYVHRKDFDALVENTLTMMMSECARFFERLPIVQNDEILRNILYSGVWVRYNSCKEKEIKGAKE